ncbi:MAG: Holliday junction branch migration protein RuvA [Pseudomonadota bacterium]
MIGKLSGIIDDMFESFVILDVNGVGYQVNCSPRTLARIGQKGDSASLLIDTNVREDAITLFGFADKSEQEWFRLLTSVQGVGAKAGMAILGVTPPDQLGFAIASGDKAALTRADGVGPKLASRILTELKDKAGKIDLSPMASGVQIPAAEQDEAGGGIDSDAVSALVNLGYGRSDAYAAVSRAKSKANDNESLQDLIRLALKELSG